MHMEKFKLWSFIPTLKFTSDLRRHELPLS